MRSGLKDAIEAGVLFGLKWAVGLGIVVLALSWLAGDYFVVRDRAKNGQWAYEFIQRGLQQQRPTVQPRAPEAPK